MKKHTRYGMIAAGVAAVILVVATIGVGMLNARAQTTPEQAVERFFTAWIDTLRRGEDPIATELHTKSTYLTGQFVRTINDAHRDGRDAVLCLGRAPQNFTVGVERIAGDDRTASVLFTADAVRGRTILVRDEQNWWRIDEVDCVDINATSTPASV